MNKTDESQGIVSLTTEAPILEAYQLQPVFKKTRTKQNDELNFHIPEKWDYEMEI